MCARHVIGKAAFININDFQPLGRVGRDLLPKDAPLFFVCLWMPQRFFYRSRPVALKRN